jgi:hypothetical protein
VQTGAYGIITRMVLHETLYKFMNDPIVLYELDVGLSGQ